MEIKTSENYNQFTTITGNRIINQGKVDRLVQDIKGGLNLLPYAPIIVYKKDESLCIVDGQHRFEASVTLGLPVHYVVCAALDLKKIARINSRSDKWKNADFMDCYIRLGMEDYSVLQNFMKKYSTTYATSISMLMYGSTMGHSTGMQKFRDGEFTANHLEKASQIMDLADQTFGRYKFWNDRALVTAIHKIDAKGILDWDVLREKIKSAPNLMEKHQNWKDAAINIEKVYNHRNSKRVVIV